MIDPILKQKIERASGVREWNPSEADLIQISREIALLKSRKSTITRSDISAIVALRCPGARFHVTAGVDNRDITSLLTMAMRQTRR